MDFPSLAELKARDTRKWTAYDADVLPLWIAESDFPTAPAVKKAIGQAVERESFGYTPATHDLPAALADFYDWRYGWRPNPEWVVTVPDVVRGVLLAVQHFTRPGSKVIMPVPAYMPFMELGTASGREVIEIDAYGGLDLAEVEGAFKDGAGALVLCSPYNPLGFTFDADELRGIVNIAAKYGGRVIVDEIHAPLVYDAPYITPASLGDVAKDVVITVTATSKAWNIAGMKCAQMIFSNEADVQAWHALDGITKDGTATLGIYAATACYRDGREELDAQVEYLSQVRHEVADRLERDIPGLRATRPAATYLMWLDFSDTKIGQLTQPAQWLRKHAKVALNEGVTFGPGGQRHARLNFATSREILTEAITRMAEAIDKV